MPGTRPYEANQLSQLTDEYRTGIPFTPPDLHDVIPTVLGTAGFEAYPGRLESIQTAVQGLFRIFSADGRSERAQERAVRLNHRKEVAAYIGDKVMTPMSSMSDPGSTKKIGWVGTSMKDSIPVKRRAEDYTNLGLQLLDFKAEPLRKEKVFGPVINDMRPTTRAHKSIDRHIEAKLERLKKHAKSARWISSTYNQEMNAKVGHKLSGSEERYMAKLSGQVGHGKRKAERAAKSIDRIANSKDIRSRVPNWRLRRAETYDDRRDHRRDVIGRVKRKIF